jgi:DHA2 family multidrug resistance protein
MSDKDLFFSERPMFSPWLIALVTMMATFMEVLDISIANVALPHIAGGLSASQEEASWILTSYLISNAVIIPLSSWLSVLFGRKRYYIISVLVFTIASVACGMASTLPALIACRIVQGLGGGGLQPMEQAILADTFRPGERGLAFTLYGIAVVIAPTIGPVLGGWIADEYGWQWIFFINVPIGIVAAGMSAVVLPESLGLKSWRISNSRFRGHGAYLGAIGIAFGCGSAQAVLDLGESRGWLESAEIRVLAAAAVAAIIVGVYYGITATKPIVDLTLLTNVQFGLSSFLMFMVGGVLSASTLLLLKYVEVTMRHSAMIAGVAMSSGGLIVMCLLPFVGRALSVVKGYYLIAVGLMITGFAFLYMTTFEPTMDLGYLIKIRCFQAAGIAFLFAPINTIAYSSVNAKNSSQAAGLLNAVRNLGGSAGISIFTTLYLHRAQFHQHRLVEQVATFDSLATDESGQALLDGNVAVVMHELQRQAESLASNDCFLVLGLLFLVLAPLPFVIRQSDRRDRPVS